MCGIIGIKGKLPEQKRFEAARDTIKHRGPDDAGIFYSPEAGIALGHCRLSIIDLSAAGQQPLWSNDGRYSIIFNGEIYNYVEIQKEIGERYAFQTQTDTEVLLAAYSIWKEKCLERLNGMFAFAIWDRETGELFAARDRLGEKPFYYSYEGQTLSFASEIKALLALGVPPRPNEKIIFDYLYYSFYDHTGETFFEGIKKLPAGHFLIFKGHEFSIKKYWDVADAKPAKPFADTEVVETFKKLLEDSIKIRYRSDVPVGLNLSSGLDSNSLYQYSNVVNGRYPAAFSMCVASSEYDECDIIDGLLNEKQKKNWHTCTTEPGEIFPGAEKMNIIQDEPYGGIPTIAYDKLSKLAHHCGVTVLIEGQGLDEILAGYKYYIAEHAKDVEALGTRSARSAHSQPTTLSQDMTKQIFPEILDKNFVQKNHHDISFPEPFDSCLLNAQYRDLMYTKLPRVLRFNDHATMAYGRELRLPYLDHRIVEFCFWLDPKFKLSDNGQKALMRQAMKEYLPKLLHGRTKKAFGAVQTEWFRKHHKKEIHEILNSDSFKSRTYWDHEKLDETVRQFFDGKGDNSFFIWQCINLELWFRKYIDPYVSSTHQTFDSKWTNITSETAARKKDEEFSIFVPPGKKPVTQRQFNLFNYYEFIKNVVANRDYRNAIEIGCGRGTIALYMALYEKLSVICNDSEKSAIELARRNFDYYGAKNSAEFMISDAATISLSDNSVDISASIGLLEHLEDYRPILREQLRILRPGGVLISLNIPKKNSVQNLNKIYRKIIGLLMPSKPLKPDYYRNKDTPEEYEARAKEIGFTDVYTVNVNPFPLFTPLHPSVEPWITALYRMVLFVRRLYLHYPFKTGYGVSQAHFLVGFKKK